MRKKVLLAALSALALAACVNDETIEMNPGNAVAFRPSTENSTRATVTTSNTIQDFKVWGYYKKNDNADYTSFMEEQVVNKAGDEWVYSPVRFWPTTGSVDFYSVSPADVTTNITKDAQQIVNYTVNTDPAQQIDLLYAVNMGCDDSNSKNGIPVNFRHALSQVVFKAKTVNPSIEVEIESITLKSVMSKGTFTFPTETTTAIGSFDTYEEAVEDGTFGKWELSKDGKDLQFYTVKLDQAKTVPSNGEAVDLTTTDNGVLLLMPQVLAESDYTYEGQTGSSAPKMEIKCKIYNVSGEDKTLVLGYPSSFGTLRNIPFEGTWQQGRKYTYTLIFGEEMGDLEKVNFTTSVDEFQSPLNENTNIQQPLNGVNMDADVTTYGGGNCFVIPKNEEETIRYYFDPSKEGRSNDPIGTVAKPNDDARKAWLMHENTEGMLTDIAYYPKEKKIAFNIEKGRTGNAIVAITDGVDNVLWSWHIWVVDDNAFMTETESGDYMDRNMGAISKAARNGNTQDIGVFYQYGRHTPALATGYSSYSGVLIEYADFLQNSHKFIKSSDDEWIGPHGEDLSKTLWSKENLSKYNPAPKGWTLPDSKEFITWFKGQKKKVVPDTGDFILVIQDEEGNDIQTFYETKFIDNDGKTKSSTSAEVFYYGTSPKAIEINDRGGVMEGTFEERSQGYCIRPIKE